MITRTLSLLQRKYSSQITPHPGKPISVYGFDNFTLKPVICLIYSQTHHHYTNCIAIRWFISYCSQRLDYYNNMV